MVPKNKTVDCKDFGINARASWLNRRADTILYHYPCFKTNIDSNSRYNHILNIGF